MTSNHEAAGSNPSGLAKPVFNYLEDGFFIDLDPAAMILSIFLSFYSNMKEIGRKYGKRSSQTALRSRF